jgi:hypothetical protein
LTASGPTSASEGDSLQDPVDKYPNRLVEFGGKTALGRPGQPAELASVYVQLAADDASFATCQVYRSSGGGGQP